MTTKIARALNVWIRAVLRVAFGTWKQMQASDVALIAGSLSFATVISLVPLLAVSLSVFSAFGGFESLLSKIEPFILQNLVEGSGTEVSRVIRTSIRRIHSGAMGTVGAVALLIASTKLFHDMERGIQKVWQIKKRRPITASLFVYWLVMFLGPLLLAVILGLLGSIDLALLNIIPQSAVPLLLGIFALVSIYKFVPACPVSWRSAVISAAVAAVGFSLAKAFYASITKNLLSYSAIYGSLASIPIFLLWILVLWWICLAGVALCATLEKENRQI
jgi:membrane protein